MYTYELNDNLYINLTNECTNNCGFCVRSFNEKKQRKLFNNIDLWLENEPSSHDVINELIGKNYKKYDSIVFCGFGEPTVKLKEVLEIAKFIKENSDKRIRLNTNGQADLIHKQDTAYELSKYIDVVSISLNAESAEKYLEICQSDFGIDAYNAILEFAKKSSNYGVKTIFTAIEGLVDEEKCKQIAKSCGAEFRLREKL